MRHRQIQLLKLSFLIGCIADFVVGINWILITIGYNIPNVICSFVGEGVDYRFAMFIATIFVFGWTAVMLWGYFKPVERRGLLLITAIFLLVSIVVELIFYRQLMSAGGFILGIILRLLLIAKFSFSYWYSYKE